jgi:RNAse (barnase) inhibitor barstar
MSKLEALIDGTLAPGMYRLQSGIAASELGRRLDQTGARCFRLDGRTIADKASFLAACAAALELPAYFGHNWDALDEVLTDLSWAPAARYVILYDHAAEFARGDRRQWAAALDVLATAVDYWRNTPTPMWVLLRNTGGLAPEIGPVTHDAEAGD